MDPIHPPQPRPGPKQPCWCGSGRKYKHCHYVADCAQALPLWQRVRNVELDTVLRVARWADERFGYESVRAALHSVEAIERQATGRVEPSNEEHQGDWMGFLMSLLLSPLRPKGVPPGSNVAALYMAERGAALDEAARTLLEGVATQRFSFWQVRECQPGQGLRVRDVLLGRELDVVEKAASTQAVPGLLAFGRVIQVGPHHLFMRMAPDAFPPERLGQVVEWRKEFGPLSREFLLTNWEGPLELFFEMRHEQLHPAPPVLKNTHGEDLEPQTLVYDLKIGLRESVQALAPLGPEDAEEVLAQAQRDKRGGLKRAQITWIGPDKAAVFGGHGVSLGTLVLTVGKLTVEVNSAKRAARVRKLIGKRLGPAAIFKSAKVQGLAALLDKAGQDAEGPGDHVDVTVSSRRVAFPASALKPGQDPMELPELREQILAMGRQHWQAWLDTPLPALGGLSPRKAAKTAEGRELLEALFYDFESRAGMPNLMAPDVAQLKRELGMGPAKMDGTASTS